MIPSPTAQGADGFVPHSGGAVFNTAIALGRLGAPVGMLTGLSQDLFGQQLADGLRASHVDLAHIVQVDRPTTLAFVVLRGGHASYVFYDENTAGRMLFRDEIPPLSPQLSALYFGGISLAAEPGAVTYAALLRENAAQHAVMIDPNIRPAFIRDEARYRERLAEMISLADIVKVSDEDLDWILTGDAPLEAKASMLLRAGPSVVIVTRGSAGALGFLKSGDVVSCAAPKADVVDTVGAGDTFNAGVLAALNSAGLLHKDALRALPPDALKAALSMGARVAAITVSRAGANPPWAKEI